MEKTYVTTDEFNTLKRALDTLQQSLSQGQQTGGQFQADKKVVGHEDVSHDVGVDEATSADLVTNKRLWDWNSKLLAASEQSERVKTHDYDISLKSHQLKIAELELARKEHDFAIKQQLDQIAVSEAQQASVIKHIVNSSIVEAQFPVRDDESQAKS